MKVDTELASFFWKMKVLNTDSYRLSERVGFDLSNDRPVTFVYKWEQSSAGGDPYSWSEEYYYLMMPLTWIQDLVKHTKQHGESEA